VRVDVLGPDDWRPYLMLGFVDTDERRIGDGIDGRDLRGMRRL
jgi:hypothetical protein